MAESYRAQMREEDFPLYESKPQPVGFGTYDHLAALASWLSLALPGRGGVGNSADPLRKLVDVLMRQERPVGKQRIPGDLPWVTRSPSDPETRVVQSSPFAGGVSELETLGKLSGGSAIPADLNRYLARTHGSRQSPGIISNPERHVLNLSPSDVYDWLRRMSTAKPNMDWRKVGGRFKF